MQSDLVSSWYLRISFMHLFQVFLKSIFQVFQFLWGQNILLLVLIWHPFLLPSPVVAISLQTLRCKEVFSINDFPWEGKFSQKKKKWLHHLLYRSKTVLPDTEVKTDIAGKRGKWELGFRVHQGLCIFPYHPIYSINIFYSFSIKIHFHWETWHCCELKWIHLTICIFKFCFDFQHCSWKRR